MKTWPFGIRSANQILRSVTSNSALGPRGNVLRSHTSFRACCPTPHRHPWPTFRRICLCLSRVTSVLRVCLIDYRRRPDWEAEETNDTPLKQWIIDSPTLTDTDFVRKDVVLSPPAQTSIARDDKITGTIAERKVSSETPTRRLPTTTQPPVTDPHIQRNRMRPGWIEGGSSFKGLNGVSGKL